MRISRNFDDDWLDPALEERWDKILAVRGEASKVLEKLRADRVIGHSLDAKVEIYAETIAADLLNQL